MNHILRITSLFMLIFPVIGMAQENNEMKYLFDGNQKIHISGFGGPFIEFSQVQSEFGVMVGGGGGLIFNQRFYLGGYGMGLSTTHYWPDKKKITGMQDPRLSFGHGGFILGYIPNPVSVFHVSISSMIGWGSISLYDAWDKDQVDHKGVDNVFVAVPKVEIEANLTRWFKVNFGAGYRYVGGIDKAYIYNGQEYYYYQSSDFNSPVFNLSLFFGGFGKKPAQQEIK